MARTISARHKKRQKKKGYAEGDVVTADDITPEVLEDEEVIGKIKAYGFEAPPSEDCFSVTVEEVDVDDVEVKSNYGAALSVISGDIQFPDGSSYAMSQITNDVFEAIKGYNYCKAYYSLGPENQGWFILKRCPQKYQFEIEFKSVEGCLVVAFGVGYIRVDIGIVD